MQPLTVTGTIDGVNAVFALSATPSFLMLWRNGLLQNPASYAVAGAGFTFLPGSVFPQPGDDLEAYGDISTPTGAYLLISGAGPAFTLSAAPLLLEWYRNGQLQTPGSQYTLSGATVTTLGAAIPLPGDDLIAVSRLTAVNLGIAGAVDGVNPDFVLSPTPWFLEWYRNGQLQMAGTQYTLSGATVTTLGAAIPGLGDDLIAIADFAAPPPPGPAPWPPLPPPSPLPLTLVRVILRGVKRTRTGQDPELCACAEPEHVKRAV